MEIHQLSTLVYKLCCRRVELAEFWLRNQWCLNDRKHIKYGNAAAYAVCWWVILPASSASNRLSCRQTRNWGKCDQHQPVFPWLQNRKWASAASFSSSRWHIRMSWRLSPKWNVTWLTGARYSLRMCEFQLSQKYINMKVRWTGNSVLSVGVNVRVNVFMCVCCVIA